MRFNTDHYNWSWAVHYATKICEHSMHFPLTAVSHLGGGAGCGGGNHLVLKSVTIHILKNKEKTKSLNVHSLYYKYCISDQKGGLKLRKDFAEHCRSEILKIRQIQQKLWPKN